MSVTQGVSSRVLHRVECYTEDFLVECYIGGFLDKCYTGFFLDKCYTGGFLVECYTGGFPEYHRGILPRGIVGEYKL